MFDGQTVLVTGGAGSFGTLFVKTVLAQFNVKKLIVYSRDEFKHYQLRSQIDDPRLRLFVGNVRDADRLYQAMNGVDYVVHAAALKQVPAAEYNPMECLKTNVHGAEHVLHAAIRNDVKRVIALSTDKAANPINLYGASKLAADKLMVAGNNLTGGHPTRFSVVRYGNVVGSRGSVVPFFRKLLEDGATELPVTDQRMTRFWITLQQGVDFVLKAFQRMQGGEIFVPKIPSMRIMDLCEAMAPGTPIKEIGIRPGEKLHEVMCPSESSHLTLGFHDHFVIKPSVKFFDMDVSYESNLLGERAEPVPDGWEYESGTNEHFLSVEELREWNDGVPA